MSEIKLIVESKNLSDKSGKYSVSAYRDRLKKSNREKIK